MRKLAANLSLLIYSTFQLLPSVSIAGPLNNYMCKELANQSESMYSLLKGAENDRALKNKILNGEGPIAFKARFGSLDAMLEEFVSKSERYKCVEPKQRYIACQNIVNGWRARGGPSQKPQSVRK